MINDGIHEAKQNAGREQGEGNLPEGLPLGCTLHVGNLIQVSRNGLQANDEDDDLDAHTPNQGEERTGIIGKFFNVLGQETKAFDNLFNEACHLAGHQHIGAVQIVQFINLTGIAKHFHNDVRCEDNRQEQAGTEQQTAGELVV